MNWKHKPLASYTRISQKYSNSHKGLDLAAPKGTAIYAVNDGTVYKAGNGVLDSSYGNQVVIKHSDGTYTNYAHMSKITTSAGKKVSAGTKIGEVGMTGKATGNHLHIEEHNPGLWDRVNPLPYLQAVEKGGSSGGYTVGKTFKVVASSGVKVREGAGKNYAQKKKSELTKDGQKNAKDKELAVLRKGTKVTCQKVVAVDGDTWLKIPSGYICAVENGDVYVE